MKAILLSFILGTSLNAFQSAQPPARDIPKEPAGTATIEGVVQVEGPPARPLRRATVRIVGDPLLIGRQVVTGDDGRFAFVNVPAGQYTLTARKSSYLVAEYGARRPGGTGARIALVEGQRMRDIQLRLAKYGAIGGTIYDQNGEPAQGMSVEVLRYTMRTGRRTLSSVYGQPATTDDRGVYRVVGLDAGEYFVAAGPSPDIARGDLQLLSASDIDRVLQTLSRGVALPPAGAAAASGAHVSFAPVFYPGSPEVANATPITLKLSEDRSGVDIRLQLVPTARIEGMVADAEGRPAAGVQIVGTAILGAFSLDLFSAGNLGTARSDAQGRFNYAAVPPGHYVVTARTTAAPGQQAAGAGLDPGPLWAMADLNVDGSDQSIALRLQPGVSVSGTIAFDGTTLQRPANVSGLRVSLTSSPTGSGVAIGVPGVSPTNVGAFTFAGVAPGEFKLSSSAPSSPTGWVLRSAVVDGVDSLDVPFEVKPGRSVEGAVVTFTDHPTELSGDLQAATGVPTSEYFIIVFATDKKFWTPASRRTVMARPAMTGRYSIRNLPPGEYFIAAVTDVEQGDWFDPKFLERLVDASVRVTLGEGDKKIQDLRLR